MINISSGDDYAQLLIDEILKDEEESYNKMPMILLSFWFDEIKTLADITWNQYIVGKRDMYEFDNEEFEQTFNNAGMRYTEELLNGLVDKELVEVGVGEKGDILYKITDEGIKHINNKL